MTMTQVTCDHYYFASCKWHLPVVLHVVYGIQSLFNTWWTVHIRCWFHMCWMAYATNSKCNDGVWIRSCMQWMAIASDFACTFCKLFFHHAIMWLLYFNHEPDCLRTICYFTNKFCKHRACDVWCGCCMSGMLLQDTDFLEKPSHLINVKCLLLLTTYTKEYTKEKVNTDRLVGPDKTVCSHYKNYII